MPTVKHGSKTSTMLLVELIFNEPLEGLLAGWDARGLRPPAMAEQIRARGIRVTDVTVRNWIRDLGGRRSLSFPEDGPVRRAGPSPPETQKEEAGTQKEETGRHGNLGTPAQRG